jgi:hypothetical protein
VETSNRTKIVLYLMLGTTSIIFFLFGVQIPHLVPRLLSALPLLITSVVGIFDRWLWHLPLVRNFVHRPWIAGTWVGELTSYRRDPGTDAPITSKHAVVLRIDQTLTSVTAVLMTAESKSRSLAAEFTRHPNDDYTLHYTYDNTPKLEYRDRSKIHRGSTAAEVHGPTPETMESEYWTNRDSKGTFTLRRVSRKRAASFDEGNTLAKPPKENK